MIRIIYINKLNCYAASYCHWKCLCITLQLVWAPGISATARKQRKTGKLWITGSDNIVFCSSETIFRKCVFLRKQDHLPVRTTSTLKSYRWSSSQVASGIRVWADPKQFGVVHIVPNSCRLRHIGFISELRRGHFELRTQALTHLRGRGHTRAEEVS